MENTDHITSEDLDRAIADGYLFNYLEVLEKAKQEIEDVYNNNRIETEDDCDDC